MLIRARMSDSSVDSATQEGHHERVPERPGGSVGCDVCGIVLDAEKVSAHDAWHRVDEERFERLDQALRELLDLVRDRRA